MIRAKIVAAALALLAAPAAWATECVGSDLFQTMPADQLQEIDAAVAKVPYAEGILWRASKGDQQITMVGTYHFMDARHQTILDRVAPDLNDAHALFVEAGPEEEQRLTQALLDDPSLMADVSGPTLPERLSAKEWNILSTAMSERGFPAVITSKLRPWYVAMMLGVSPCMMAQISEEQELSGLDHMLVDRAQELGLPVNALEPWNTVFSLFNNLTPEQEIDMVRTALPTAALADDYGVTLSEAYFRGDIWAIWELARSDSYRNSDMSRAEIDEQLRLAQEQLMDNRNQSWIAPLTRAATRAAKEGKGVVAGFGALHLPGEQGVLRLLENDGWKIERLDG